MGVLGQACLLTALGLSVYGAGASLYGAAPGRERWVVSGRRSLYALFAVVALAFLLLEIAFVTSDFTFPVVAGQSSLTTPWYYRIAAAWATQEGSLLLWLLLLSGASSLAIFSVRGRMRDVTPYATAVLLGLGAFFAAVLFFTASPFERVAVGPADGLGLNPLLRHPSVLIHPIFLYGGYTLFSVPFAFAIGALIVRRVDAEWIRATRFFTLTAWLLLGTGILLGARWSYAELGWGGYWAWDPVENASLLPWLVGTAFLHSAMIQERRGMLKVWNASLILATGVLCILGTFLVRSGILDSIHAFVQEGNTIAWAFTSLIVVMTAGAVYLVVTRASDTLRSDARIDSLLSRESMFLANNVTFVSITFVVFLGTFYPLITDALGEKRALGPPWFDDYIVPFVLVLVLLSGIGPVIAWRRSTPSRLWRSLRVPALAGIAVLVLGPLLTRAEESPLSLAMFALGTFAIGTGLQELYRGMRARQAMTGESPPLALAGVVRRNRRRYGGYLVHIGISVMFIGVAASTAFQHERDVRLTPGQSAKVGGYTFTYERPIARIAQRAGELERIALGSRVRVERDGKLVTVLRPERAYYPINAPMMGAISRYFEGNATSEIGLKAGLRRDLWIAEQPDIATLQPIIKAGDKVFADARGDLTARQRGDFLGVALGGLVNRYRTSEPPGQFRILVSPLVTFLWLGALFSLAGGLLAAWPEPGMLRGRVRAGYAARLAQELRRA